MIEAFQAILCAEGNHLLHFVLRKLILIGSCGMTAEDEQQLTPQTMLPSGSQASQAPRCPTCAEFTHLSHQFLDPRNGRTIRLYQCLCGERVWDN